MSVDMYGGRGEGGVREKQGVKTIIMGNAVIFSVCGLCELYQICGNSRLCNKQRQQLGNKGNYYCT